VIDLHTHSTVSDGSDAPARIPELAADAGCTAVALTDHDRLDGVPAARARAQDLGIELIAGCELSCEVETGTMHVLVYFLEPGDGPLQDELVRLQQVRDNRNRVMCERLQISYESLQEEAGGIGAGRPHAAAILVRQGRAHSIKDAFDKWLARGRPGYVEKERLTPADAVRLATLSGALAVLAHPFTLELDPLPLESRVRELAGLGLAGVEALYSRYSPEDRQGLADMARRHGLAVTGGSDHHGTYKPDLRVGIGAGDLVVPDDVLDDLRERLVS
jgi:3',5'-nucleoside bisphosphate phosphatase